MRADCDDAAATAALAAALATLAAADHSYSYATSAAVTRPQAGANDSAGTYQERLCRRVDCASVARCARQCDACLAAGNCNCDVLFAGRASHSKLAVPRRSWLGVRLARAEVT